MFLVAAGSAREGLAQVPTVRKDTLPELHVTAKKIKIDEKQQPGRQTLDRSNFDVTNSSSVAEAVRHFSGVQLIDYGGIGGLKTINLRSLGASQTGVYYDGLRLSEASNGQVDLGKYSLDGLEMIGLSESSSHDLLVAAGTFASSGALFLVSAIPVFKSGKIRHIRASLTTGSFGLFNPSLTFEQKINAHFNGSIEAGVQTANGSYPYHIHNGTTDSTLLRQNSWLNSYRTQLALFGSFRDSSLLNVKIYEYHAARGLPGAVILNNINSRQKLGDQDFFIQSSYKLPVTKNYALLGQAKYSKDYTRYLDPDYLNIANKLDDRYAEKQVLISLANQIKLLSSWSLALSTDYQDTRMDANLPSFAYPVRREWLNALSSSFDTQYFRLQATVLNSRSSEQVRIGSSVGNQPARNNYSPLLLAAVRISQELELEAFYKAVFRLPTFNELYYTRSGNPLLRPENTRQFSVGFNLHSALIPLTIRAAAYINKVSDKILAIPTNNLFFWSYLNLGRVAIRGLEASINTSLSLAEINFHSAVNITWQRSIDVTPHSYTYGQQIPYAPQLSGSGTVSATWRALGLNYNVLYNGARYSLRDNTADNYLSAWTVHEAAVFYKRRGLRVQAEVNNLFAASYEVIRSFPMPGRSYRVRLAIEY